MDKRILIVEDERTIADTLVYALSTDGFKTKWVSTGGDGVRAILEGGYDLLILDIGLPDKSGLECCREIREHSMIPIFFLTARADEIDRILGLEIGADDYITKPFSPREVSTRVRAFFRRHAAHTLPEKDVQTWGPFEVDLSRYQISLGGQILDLRRYEFGILHFLLQNPGRVYSRGQLMNAIWDEPEMSMERTVDAHVKTIRSRLRKYSEKEWIVTHRGLGYSLQEKL